MKPAIRAALFVGAAITSPFVVLSIAYHVLHPCTVKDIASVVCYSLSVPPVLVYLSWRLVVSRALWPSLLRATVALVFAVLLAANTVFNLFGTFDRARQKRAMLQLRELSSEYESQRKHGLLSLGRQLGPLDPWDQPIYIATRPNHYVLVSCGECGGTPMSPDLWSYQPGPTTGLTSDIVYSDGSFLAYPEGVALPAAR